MRSIHSHQCHVITIRETGYSAVVPKRTKWQGDWTTLLFGTGPADMIDAALSVGETLKR